MCFCFLCRGLNSITSFKQPFSRTEGEATLSPLVLAAGDVMQQSEAEGMVLSDDKTAFAAELQGEAAAHQVR